MLSKAFKPVMLVVILAAMLVAACGGGGKATPAAAPTQPPAPTQAPQPTEPPAKPTEPPAKPTEPPAEPTQPPTVEPKSGAIDKIENVKQATIQIESQGTFIDPQVGVVVNGAGRGSGFIIDPSGIAVTNNHVVTGAALLKVWVGGNQDKVYNAKVLGVSECSDLAVIDIQGEGFPYLEWFSDPVDVGKEIYVAGFPLGDPEYSLTKGIISKAKTSGETSWASVDHVLEYDATSNPGNSGGPVVTEDGRIVAVHYAGQGDTRQAFGISTDIAKPVIDQLRTGNNLETLGVNGQAVGNEDGSLTGIWVASVESGSPADKAGVRAGDIILELENLVLATDYTMSDYCDILRSHDAGDTLNIKVLRFADGSVMEGQINGRELEVVSTFDVGPQSDTSTGATGNTQASQSGDVYFATGFDDAEGWYVITVPEEDNYEVTQENSTLRVSVPTDYTTVYTLYDFDIPSPDIRLDTTVDNVGDTNRNNISLVCRATDAGWYEFSMTTGGEWYIYKYQNKEYTLLGNGASRAINMMKATNELIATCIGNELTFYVNGTLMGSVKDRSFTGSGQTGLSVSTFDVPGAEAIFDWFTASVP